MRGRSWKTTSFFIYEDTHNLSLTIAGKIYEIYGVFSEFCRKSA